MTHKDANKGAVVDFLSRHLQLPTAEIATIGDQPNDVLMFKRSGFSIAMGNASDEVKRQATATTDSYNDEGFAKAMERFILGLGGLRRRYGRERAHRDPAGSGGAGAARGRMDDGGRARGEGRLPGVAVWRLDPEGALRAPRFR